MANLAAARAALQKVEGILRRRYHYPHPIFEHLATAQENIAEEPEKVAPPETAGPTATSAAPAEKPRRKAMR